MRKVRIAALLCFVWAVTTKEQAEKDVIHSEQNGIWCTDAYPFRCMTNKGIWFSFGTTAQPSTIACHPDRGLPAGR
ncbi:hypothetical protein [Agriterribacter humi]|uniref:hypothetical protein n=1 Tax=Agriterribacter humi TaxID=1104781 RepID=UPI0012646024|nr:hypothetical protein [Agriterribacter humi]